MSFRTAWPPVAEELLTKTNSCKKLVGYFIWWDLKPQGILSCYMIWPYSHQTYILNLSRRFLLRSCFCTSLSAIFPTSFSGCTSYLSTLDARERGKGAVGQPWILTSRAVEYRCHARRDCPALVRYPRIDTLKADAPSQSTNERTAVYGALRRPLG